jgi:hypothetical protein
VPTILVRRLAGALALSAALALALAAGAQAYTTTVVTSRSLSEPGVDVAPDGTLYVNAPGGLLSSLPGSPSFIYRSGDGGATWRETPPSLRANLPGGGDSDLAIDPANGHLAFSDLWLGSSTVASSTDKGESWLASPLQGIVVQDRQWVAAAGNDVVYHLTHQIPSGLIVSKSVNGGLLYPIHTIAATVADQTGFIGPAGPIIAQGGGGLLGTSDKVGFAYPTSTAGVKFARSTNGGLTFSSVPIGGTSSDVGQAFPVVADAGGGHLIATWMAVKNGRSSIGMARSSDWGATWGAPQTIVADGTSVYPWVSAHGANVAVSLFHTTAVGEPSTVPATATFYESALTSTDGGATFGALQTVDATPAKTGPICTAGIDCTADRELGDFQSTTMDGSGHAYFSWARVIPGGTATEIRFAR